MTRPDAITQEAQPCWHLRLPNGEQVIRARLGAVSFLQRKVRVGFSTAGQLLFALEDMGIVAPSDGTSRAREVLVAMTDPVHISACAPHNGGSAR